MKLAFVTLLLVNVGLFAWHYDRHVEAVTRAALDRPALSESVPRLVLLREMAAVPQPRRTADAVHSAADTAGPRRETMADVEAADRCVEAGPFEEAARRDAFRDWLRGYAAALETRTETVRKRQLFWVYLEPASDADARKRIADLQQRGVQDYMLIRRGGLRNAISLGLFSSQDSVNRRLAELSEQGYQPVVVPRYETTDRFWLRAQLAAEHEALPDAPTDLLAGARLLERPCDQLTPAAGAGGAAAAIESDRIADESEETE